MVANFLKNAEIRKKIAITAILIVVFRLVAHVPVPGIDLNAIRSYIQGNAFFGLLDLFNGGGFQNFSIATLGLAPYINVSIAMQLLTMMIPSLEELQKEGEYGREKINMYTKLLTVPMSMIQGYGIYFWLNRQGVIRTLSPLDLIIFVLTLTAGAILLVWLGELISEYGIGNGISLLIFVGIISQLPAGITGYLASVTSYNFGNTLLFAALSLAVIVAVVLINEGTRNVAIEYGRSGVRSEKISNFLPIKVNQAGVIPIIFAVSLVLIPSMISGPLQASSNDLAHKAGYFLAQNFNANSVGYNILYFLLVVGFTYFYTSVQFNSEKVADDIKKRGGFIPGIRPGKSTADFLKAIVNRITFTGALFLGVIAILPYLVQKYIGVSNLSIGGTGLLIVVSVVLETVRQMESLMVTRNYDSFLR